MHDDKRLAFPIAMRQAIDKTLSKVLAGNGTDAVLEFSDGTRLFVAGDYDGDVNATWEPDWTDEDRAYVKAIEPRPEG